MSVTLKDKTSQPIAGVVFPSSATITAALAYMDSHSTPVVVNHVMRSAYFALIIGPKLPPFKDVSASKLVLAIIMHDLGWDPTGELVSTDKRFEVDGANAARDFLRKQDPSFGDADLQLVWDAIALHSSFSIAVHKEPLVGLSCIGIVTDFLGPNNAKVLKLGREVLTPDEWRAVEKVFPYMDLEEGIQQAMCGLCLSKPETTYDNLVGQFGVKYLPGYSLEGKQTIDVIENGLKGLEEFRK
ncbi:hypothetical protein BDZ89DRAFT_1073670 [Hymenopellis radicata]|nr:hypothetical protein BDZ89DRAFT_1073670 [Hymenopellis radicata]